MGICISSASSEMYQAEDGIENVIYIEENTAFNGVKRLGSLYSRHGSKGVKQDAAVLHQGCGVQDGAFCGVFDGHGKNGHIVSKIVRNSLPSLLLCQKNALGKIKKVAEGNNEEVEVDLLPIKNFYIWKEACVSGFKLRAVLGIINENGIMPIQLTTDLKPGVPSEADRIRKCNGSVLALREEPHIQRVWLPHEDSPGLAINNQVAFIVWAADSEQAAAKALVEFAVAAWKKLPCSKVHDCTAVCPCLHKRQR
ncbi:hypothetical protein P3X46_007389 [Hevea brasiliensis]|uniref:PPM-type phosphatase domain-containing protein n=1 Tax=Hevea brasiliensis TaxID=3981 RepID=A0ABQ9MXH2_HEVBR|nr:hypothetical protein P3X46_007389 [Hevea brasiliensis]